MDRENLYRQISIKNEKKMIMIVLDGLGGLPVNEKTELETAKTPNIDKLASSSELGLSQPIAPGITPGSGPAHIALFGYDPFKYKIGRGILEALGIGIKVEPKDIAIRGNLATQVDGIITDRRAGRISSQDNKRIISVLRKKITKIEDVEIKLFSGAEHRFVVILKGDKLSAEVSDADPETIGKPMVYTTPVSKEAKKSSRIINTFIDLVTKELRDLHPANTCLLRGAAKYPEIPSMQEIFKLNPAAIADYPMYRGLAKLVGMDILATDNSMTAEITTLKKNYHLFNFFFLHVKKTDSYGEDGNFEKKIQIIEEFDHQLSEIIKLNPDTIVITGDHSTPSLLKSHSWHPNPLLIKSKYQRHNPEKITDFSEKSCAKGILGNLTSQDILPLMMANSLKFKKYGA